MAVGACRALLTGCAAFCQTVACMTVGCKDDVAALTCGLVALQKQLMMLPTDMVSFACFSACCC